MSCYRNDKLRLKLFKLQKL